MARAETSVEGMETLKAFCLESVGETISNLNVPTPPATCHKVS